MSIRFGVGGLVLGALAVAAPPLLAQSDSPKPQWNIVSLGDEPALGGATMGFGGDGGVFGSTGCNSYRGSAAQVRNMLIFSGPFISTRMACEEGIMKQETQLFALFAGSAEIGYDVSADRLELTSPDGLKVVLERAE